MKLFKNKNVLCILTIIPMIIGVISLAFLPNIIPIHWGFDGNVNSYGSKYIILTLPIVSIVVLGIYALRLKFGTATENKDAVGMLQLVLNILMVMVITITFNSISDNPIFNNSNIGIFALGLIIIITGNYMPKFRRNGIAGIRTPWTISNDKVWYKTHRIGGKITVVAGILIIIMSMIFDNITLVPVLIIVILGFVSACIYSYIITEA